MTNPEDAVAALPSCRFARTGGGVATQDPPCVWGHEDGAESWEVPAGQLPPPTPPDAKGNGRHGRGAKSKPPPPYKHVPHREKPPQLVARRNARERRRVQAVNLAFSRLRGAVPIDHNRGKRVSKVKTLHKAIEYISQLQDLLLEAGPVRERVAGNKENKGQASNRWEVLQGGCRPAAGAPDSLAQLLQDFTDDF